MYRYAMAMQANVSTQLAASVAVSVFARAERSHGAPRPQRAQVRLRAADSDHPDLPTEQCRHAQQCEEVAHGFFGRVLRDVDLLGEIAASSAFSTAAMSASAAGFSAATSSMSAALRTYPSPMVFKMDW